jgi:hypothetical protein
VWNGLGDFSGSEAVNSPPCYEGTIGFERSFVFFCSIHKIDVHDIDKWLKFFETQPETACERLGGSLYYYLKSYARGVPSGSKFLNLWVILFGFHEHNYNAVLPAGEARNRY